MNLGKIARTLGLRPGSELYFRVRDLYLRTRSPRSYARTYAQFGEDRALLRLLGGRPGTYIDVGAGDPLKYSNTYLLYQEGWSGYAIDPIEANARRWGRIRPRDTFIRGICGGDSQSVAFWEMAEPSLSTALEYVASDLQVRGYVLRRRYDVVSVKLADLGLRAMPNSPSLLSIDVEGMEMDVLAGIDWNLYCPQVICMEQWSSPLQGASESHSFLLSHGYALREFMGLSGIYVHVDSTL